MLAVDIQPEMLALIRQRQKDARSQRRAGHGHGDRPEAAGRAVDLILMVDVYHEFSHPYEMAEAMVKALKPGGRLVFVEYRLEDQNVPIKLVHKMSEKQVIKEMAPHPLAASRRSPSLPWQHVIVFEKKEP